MDDELNYLQNQIMRDITEAETIIATSRELVKYLNLNNGFHDELELASSTLQELVQRTSKAFEPAYLASFVLATKQVRMMAVDLLNTCKEKMISA